MTLGELPIVAHAALLVLAWIVLSLVMHASLRQVRTLEEVLPAAGGSTGPDADSGSPASRGRADRPRRPNTGGAVSAPAGGANPARGTAASSSSRTPTLVGPEGLPTLSIVIAARDEAASIEGTIRRLLDQRYDGLQIVAVDDRSTDGTGRILDRFEREAAPGRLDVVHATALPPGWLGKCHACWVGAGRARGDWILFMDGDVSLSREDLLAQVVRMALGNGLDHLSVIPDMGPMPRLQSALVSVFGGTFLLATRAYEMDRDRPRGGAGVGAFQLVRREAYDRVKGHELVRMDPAEDIKLGGLLKESGARQRLYNGLGLVKCPWHRGTVNVIRGLEKNGFAGCRYSLSILSLFTVMSLWLAFGPVLHGISSAVLAPQAPGGPLVAWLPLIVQEALLATGWILSARRLRWPSSTVWLYQIAVFLLLLAMWNSAIRTLHRGGIAWRDTFYPLAELQKGLVRPGAGRSLSRASAGLPRTPDSPALHQPADGDAAGAGE